MNGLAAISGLKGFDAGKGFDFSDDSKKLFEKSGVFDFGDIGGISILDKREGGNRRDLGGISGLKNLKIDGELKGLNGFKGIDGLNQSKRCYGPECDYQYYSAPRHKQPIRIE